MAARDKHVRQRLRQAALELYREQGFDRTTAAQIAARAGVTGRTFFRHFADKREVVFEEEALRTAMLAGMAAAPGDVPALEALLWAFRAAEPLLDENRPSANLRREVVAGTPALRERALAKSAALTDDLAAALRDRGVEDGIATLAAQVGMAAGARAIAAWGADPHCHWTFTCVARSRNSAPCRPSSSSRREHKMHEGEQACHGARTPSTFRPLANLGPL